MPTSVYTTVRAMAPCGHSTVVPNAAYSIPTETVCSGEERRVWLVIVREEEGKSGLTWPRCFWSRP